MCFCYRQIWCNGFCFLAVRYTNLWKLKILQLLFLLFLLHRSFPLQLTCNYWTDYISWWFVVFSLRSPLRSSYHSGASDFLYSRSHFQDSGDMLNMCSTFDLHKESRKLCICTNQLHSTYRGSPSESTKNKNLNSTSACIPVYNFEECGIIRSIFSLKPANLTNKTMHECTATNMATLISDFVILCKLKSFVSHQQIRSCLSFDIPIWEVFMICDFGSLFFFFFSWNDVCWENKGAVNSIRRSEHISEERSNASRLTGYSEPFDTLQTLKYCALWLCSPKRTRWYTSTLLNKASDISYMVMCQIENVEK